MRFSYENMDIVENHTWHANYSRSTSSFYAATVIDRKYCSFLQAVFPDMKKGYTGDHKDGDSMNNYLSNIRPVSYTIQSINRRMSKNNTSGFIGVSYKKSRCAWRASWNNKKKQLRSKSFSVEKYGEEKAKAKAVAYRKKKVDSLTTYKKALCKQESGHQFEIPCLLSPRLRKGAKKR